MNSMISLEHIKQRILQGEQIEQIIEEIDWKDFEELVTEILEKHDFKTHHNFRFKTERRYEIDVLGIRNDIILLIDCKQWGKGRYKKSALKNAINHQKQRTEQLKTFLKNNIIAQAKLKITRLAKTTFIPLIVTWLEEDLIEYENVLIVPIWKFNEFLLDMSKYV